MKNFLQTTLMIFALGLCALCTWQWYIQVLQHREITRLAQTNYDQSVAIGGYTNSINTMDHQIAQMDATISELREIVKSNNITIAQLRADNNRLSSLTEQYSNAVARLEDQIKLANENIRRENEAVKSLVAERDDFVSRLNQSIKERNQIVTQYNELVKKVEEMQAAQSKKPQK
jgi:chromosome segregation ATPase